MQQLERSETLCALFFALAFIGGCLPHRHEPGEEFMFPICVVGFFLMAFYSIRLLTRNTDGL